MRDHNYVHLWSLWDLCGPPIYNSRQLRAKSIAIVVVTFPATHEPHTVRSISDPKIDNFLLLVHRHHDGNEHRACQAVS